ncbi:hypothetical protein [Neorhizobium galegae]|nr:hypothetical protein [Neorhizobium galegae]
MATKTLLVRTGFRFHAVAAIFIGIGTVVRKMLFLMKLLKIITPVEKALPLRCTPSPQNRVGGVGVTVRSIGGKAMRSLLLGAATALGMIFAGSAWAETVRVLTIETNTPGARDYYTNGDESLLRPYYGSGKADSGGADVRYFSLSRRMRS